MRPLILGEIRLKQLGELRPYSAERPIQARALPTSASAPPKNRPWAPSDQLLPSHMFPHVRHACRTHLLQKEPCLPCSRTCVSRVSTGAQGTSCSKLTANAFSQAIRQVCPPSWPLRSTAACVPPAALFMKQSCLPIPYRRPPFACSSPSPGPFLSSKHGWARATNRAAPHPAGNACRGSGSKAGGWARLPRCTPGATIQPPG
jgi:hypothetical protein